jgi:hypothetical protein
VIKRRGIWLVLGVGNLTPYLGADSELEMKLEGSKA